MNIDQKTKSPFLLVLLLWIAGLGAAAQFAKFAVLFPDIQKLYPSLGPQAGLLVSVIGFLGIIFGLFAGLLVARIGYKLLLIVALLLGGMISFIQLMPLSFGGMLTSRLLEGVSHLIIVVATPTLISLVSADRYRNMAMTLWSTFFGVAFAIMAWGGIPLAATYGVKAIFLIHGVVMLVTGILLAVCLPQHDSIVPPQKFNIGLIVREHIRAYRSPFISAPALGWLFYTITFVSLLTVLPTMVESQDRAFVAGTMPIVSIISSLVIGMWILPKFKAINVVIAGFILALGIICMVWTGAKLSYVSILLFVALGLVQGASFAAIPQLNALPENQALSNGAMAQMGNLGNTIGTPLFLVLLSYFEISGLIIGSVICYGIGAALHLLLARCRHRCTHSS